MLRVVFDTTLYPTAAKFASYEIQVPFFSTNMSNRVTPTGYFPGSSGAIEYFFGAATGTLGPGVGAVPIQNFVIYQICEHDTIAWRVDALWREILAITNNLPQGTVETDCMKNGSNITVVGTMQFNENGTQIIMNDLILPRFSEYMELLKSPHYTYF